MGQLLKVIVGIVISLLAADFVSGLLHWLEDAYGREQWPVTGKLITKPNILHHHRPRYFTHHSWLYSSWLLLLVGLLVLLVSWVIGTLTWQVFLFVFLGTNANQIHKWSHRTGAENGPLITFLQRARLVQTPHHHARHHTDPKNSHYCVLTNFLNPILDRIGFWQGLEALSCRVFGLRRRIDTSVNCTTGPTPSESGPPKSAFLSSEGLTFSRDERESFRSMRGTLKSPHCFKTPKGMY